MDDFLRGFPKAGCPTYTPSHANFCCWLPLCQNVVGVGQQTVWLNQPPSHKDTPPKKSLATLSCFFEESLDICPLQVNFPFFQKPRGVMTGVIKWIILGGESNNPIL